MTYRADLHSHSTCSDGTCTPKELIDLAKAIGLSGLSITDHDTLDAYSDETILYAKQQEVDLFTGVEFSSRYHQISVHILGYAVKKTNSILSFCLKHKKRREERNREILGKLRALSMPISDEELQTVQTGSIVGRPHIAQVMIQKNYVSSIQEAFDRFIGDRKCCFAPGKSFTVQETIDQIHAAGGKAFIAHPHLIEKQGILKVLLGMNFDGIECYYSLLHYEKEKKWLKIANEKGLLISGGSDFHGSIKPHVTLGCSFVDKETVEKIFGKR